MASFRHKHQWQLIILLAIILIAWRWLWGFCWNPLNTACFEGGGFEHVDHNQHFYGWLAYASGKPESVVPPMFSNWTWPAVIPLLFTDPIPIAAIILRPVYQLFHIKFQYFSALSLISMLISSLCGYALGCKVVGSRILGCVLGVLLALAPLAILRLYHGHEALSLHCILVIPITLLILRNSRLWIWALLIFVATGVHAYYLPLLLPLVILRTISVEMNPTKYFQKWLSRYLRQRKAPGAASADLLARLLDAGCLLLAFFSGLILFGYAAGGMIIAPKGELWSANLVALFDSQGLSSIFSPLKKIEPSQWEGFSYLGIIITTLVALSLYRLLQCDPRSRNKTEATLFPSPRIYWGLIVSSLLFSFGLRIYLGSQLVLSLEEVAQATHVDGIYELFRATGRFTWLAYYSLLLWGFCTVAQSVRNSKALAAIIFVCLLETHIPTMAHVQSSFAKRYETGLQWQQEAGRNDLERKLAASFAASDVFYNATGNPSFQAREIPPFFPQAVKPTIYTNYSPYIARRPKGFDRQNRADRCALAVHAVRLASEQGLRPPLLLMKDRTALTCRQLELIPRVRLNDRLSLYTARSIRKQ